MRTAFAHSVRQVAEVWAAALVLPQREERVLAGEIAQVLCAWRLAGGEPL